ncbi:hypothetical protein JYT19_00245 [Sulfobacillus acidophilus]|uniref:DUF5723 domain-containing protein n=1 Tax=Sulfobacillus acidophilus TaxID=53633 RepID=A0ABS3AW54_9FIRM|nr:hypothetical protein [Sulfobacillus acidophilus]
MPKIIFVVLTLLLFTDTSFAQSGIHPNCEKKSITSRCLNGHMFLLSEEMPSPFITSNLSTRLGAGTSRIEFDQGLIKKLGLGKGIITVLTGENGYRFEIKAADWLGITSYLNSNAGLGFGAEAFLEFGAKANFNFELGAKFKLFRNEKYYLTVATDFVAESQANFTPNNGFSILLQEQTISKEIFFRMVALSSQMGSRLGLLGAMGVNEIFGVWANLSYKHLLLNRQNLGDFAGLVVIGSGQSIDLNKSINFPLALLFTEQIDILISDVEHDFATLFFTGGIYYAGREDFSLGLNLSFKALPLGEKNASTYVKSIGANITARYYFN